MRRACTPVLLIGAALCVVVSPGWAADATQQPTLKDILDLYTSATTSLYGLWTFYSGVALAVLGAVYAGIKEDKRRGAKWVLFCGFFGFAMINLAAVVAAEMWREALVAAIHEAALQVQGPRARAALEHLRVPPFWLVGAVHLFLTGLTLWGIWAAPVVPAADGPNVATSHPEPQGRLKSRRQK
jgi:hypothetical protein